MASFPEKIQAAKESVWYWRGKEAPAVKVTQAAKRAYEAHKHSPEKRAWRKAQKELARVRDHINRAEHNLDSVRGEYEKMSPLAKKDDYWRDRVQDLTRERHRVCELIAQLRATDADEHNASVAERAEAMRQGASAADQAVGSIQIPVVDDVSDLVIPGTTQREVMVFTGKALTDAEKRLVEVTHLLHRAKLYLAKTRKEEEAAKGGKIGDFVNVVMQAAQIYYSGNRHPTFYSQAGAWSVTYEPHGEPWGFRSDCSQFVTACAHKAGIPDPNGQGYLGGFTGTLVNHCHSISWSQVRPGDLIIFGPGDGHHVEVHVGPGHRTVGHGSPPVDFGTDYLLADPRPFRIPV